MAAKRHARHGGASDRSIKSLMDLLRFLRITGRLAPISVGIRGYAAGTPLAWEGVIALALSGVHHEIFRPGPVLSMRLAPARLRWGRGGGGTCRYEGGVYRYGDSFPASDGCNRCS